MTNRPKHLNKYILKEKVWLQTNQQPSLNCMFYVYHQVKDILDIDSTCQGGGSFQAYMG